METESSPEEINQEKPKSILNTVTPFSKYLAMILFIVMPFIGGWIGYSFAPEKIVEVEVVPVEEFVSEKGSEPSVTDIEADNNMRFINPIRKGSFTEYEVENGLITGEWKALYGPNIHGGPQFTFTPSTEAADIIQKSSISGNKSPVFVLMDNDDNFYENLFNINVVELSNLGEDCALEGGTATILISKYNVLEGEKGLIDMAAVEDVLSFTPHTEKNCE